MDDLTTRAPGARGDWLAEEFAANRNHLIAVAYRMLGSRAEAEDAVQDAWLRLDRADPAAIENLGGWLTTVVSRLCLDVLRSRRTRGDRVADFHVADPIVEPVPVAQPGGGADPEAEAILAESVGLAMMVVLESLDPAERLAFVLHDMFAMPFEQIADVVGRSVEATRQLASRARRRVHTAPAGARRTRHVDPDHGRAAVDAFFAAARAGDIEGLVAALHPDLVLRSDAGEGAPLSQRLQGAENVARRAVMFNNPRSVLHPVRVNGQPGVVVTLGRRIFSVLAFTVDDDGKIVEIDALADRARLETLDLAGIV